jgi:hypothetical protein
MARGYAESLLKYETILTAQIFLRIFEHTSPLSKYLQTAGLDILSAHIMVASTQDMLKRLRRDFESVKQAAEKAIVRALDSDSVMDRLAEKTELLKKLLH